MVLNWIFLAIFAIFLPSPGFASHFSTPKPCFSEPPPLDRILAFLDPLLPRAPLVVKPHHPFGGPS